MEVKGTEAADWQAEYIYSYKAILNTISIQLILLTRFHTLDGIESKKNGEYR